MPWTFGSLGCFLLLPQCKQALKLVDLATKRFLMCREICGGRELSWYLPWYPPSAGAGSWQGSLMPWWFLPDRMPSGGPLAAGILVFSFKFTHSSLSHALPIAPWRYLVLWGTLLSPALVWGSLICAFQGSAPRQPQPLEKQPLPSQPTWASLSLMRDIDRHTPESFKRSDAVFSPLSTGCSQNYQVLCSQRNITPQLTSDTLEYSSTSHTTLTFVCRENKYRFCLTRIRDSNASQQKYWKQRVIDKIKS